MMRQVRGRKQVLYFSEGFDSSLMLASGEDEEAARAAELGEIWEVDTDDVFGSTKVQGDLGEMLEAFKRADCVIQAIDIGGVRADSTVQARQIGNQRIDGNTLSDRTVGQDGLFFMANETGGELFRNFNDLSDAMGRVLERTSVTYLLTIQPKDLRPDWQLPPDPGQAAQRAEGQGLPSPRLLRAHAVEPAKQDRAAPVQRRPGARQRGRWRDPCRRRRGLRASSGRRTRGATGGRDRRREPARRPLGQICSTPRSTSTPSTRTVRFEAS